MPLQTRTQIAAFVCLAILIIAGAMMQSGLLYTSGLSRPMTYASQTSSPLELTDQNFLQAINDSSLLIVDFNYPGCSKCQYLNRTITDLSNELQGQIRFGRMNEKVESQTAKKYKITSYPTIIFFEDGILLDRINGNISKSDLLSRIKEFKADLDASKVRLQDTSANAIPLARFGERKPAMPMLLGDENLNLAIGNYPFLVVDAYAPWCEYCHYLNGTILELSSELQGQVAFGLIDAEKNNDTRNSYNFTAYPTLLIYRDGKLVDQLIGNRAKSTFVSELKKYNPKLDTSMVKIADQGATQPHPSQPKQIPTPEQVCANMTKSDHPLLEAFVVSRCPFGLQMQRIMAGVVDKLPQTKDYLKVRYIGSIDNGTITSMHGNLEAQENLRQICIRDEQPDKYWDYVNCYMKEGKSSECLESSSVDHSKLSSCINDTARGLAYAQGDFDLANKSRITASPTLMMNGRTVNEFDFATNTTNGRSPEALKELLCCGFEIQPSFCSQLLDTAQAMTMFSIQAKAAPSAAIGQQAAGRDIPLAIVGLRNPTQPMLITDKTIDSAISQYPLIVLEGYANWCGYCKQFNITISDLASELQGQVAFGLIDVYKNNNQTSANYNITAYPTTLIFKDGKLADKVVGNVQKSSLADKLKLIGPKLNTSKVKLVQSAPRAPPKPKLTPKQVCANITKSDKPLLQAFVVSKCPFGLQMQRIFVSMINESKDAENYLMVRYIGAISNNTITSMHGSVEAQENLRQICIRDEQQNKYWNYLGCYMKQGSSVDCLKNVSVDQDKLNSCINDTSRGLAYAQKDFDLADKFEIMASPTLLMGDMIVSESDFATNTTNARSPQALKELLCCGFKSQPQFCSLKFDEIRAATMFSSSS